MASEEITERFARRVIHFDSFDDVVAAARDGDGNAFEQLYESLSRRLFAFVSFRGAADAEGMVNDVFLKVFTNLNEFVGNEIQFSAWVFKIARNTLIDEGRSRGRRPRETSLDDAADNAEPSRDAESEAIEHLGDRWVHAQLDVLTADQRDVVVLRVVSDLTIEAIAEVLGKRVGAVKALQRRAFRTLARSFEGQTVPR